MLFIISFKVLGMFWRIIEKVKVYVNMVNLVNPKSSNNATKTNFGIISMEIMPSTME